MRRLVAVAVLALVSCKGGGPVGTYSLDKDAMKKTMEAEIAKMPADKQGMAKLGLEMINLMDMKLALAEGGKGEMLMSMPSLGGDKKTESHAQPLTWEFKDGKVTINDGKKPNTCDLKGDKLECGAGGGDPMERIVFTKTSGSATLTGGAVAAAPAAKDAPATDKPADKPTGVAAKLVGTWRQEKELGESAPRPENARPIMTIKEDGTLHVAFPGSGTNPMTGKPDKGTDMDMKYKVAKAEGNQVTAKMTLVMKDGEMPGDDKKFTLVDDNTLEERGVTDGKETGLGANYKRFDPSAAAKAEPAKEEPAKPEPAPAKPASAACAKASKCCAVLSGASPACDALLNAPEATCTTSLKSFKKGVKASKPKKLAECN